MKILFLGGNGNISWWCSKLALEAGHEVYVAGRKFQSDTRKSLSENIKFIQCDVSNFHELNIALKDYVFDVVCDFICYSQEDAKKDVEIFKNRVKHFIFISSEAVYKRKTQYLPFKENTPLNNPVKSGKYIKGKIEAEYIFIKAYEKHSFPVTIIRPSYTYDTNVPSSIGLNCFTAMEYYSKNKLTLFAGEGNELRVFTHSKDFANALMCICGNKNSIGNDYHITTDEWLTWKDIHRIIMNALGADEYEKKYLSPRMIIKDNFFGEEDLLEQKYWHNIYDNSKIKMIIPTWSAQILFENGIHQTIKWFLESEKRKRININLIKKINLLKGA